jgi:pimeloyl-ACP methyl ester carboxylesterase
MHTRGSGFSSISYTTLAVGNLLVALLFFATPSRAQQVSCLVISVLLLVNAIIIVAVPRLRIEEGWVGIASVLWATAVGAWTVLTDRVVEWGKREEEERLTGREETRRTLREWLAVLADNIVLDVLIIVIVLLSATLILRSRDASLAPLGKRYYVDGDKYQAHLFCEGNVTDSKGRHNPTVLIEGGERPVEGGLALFAARALKNGTISRYCYWDRPGLGWSDNAPSPLSAGMAVDALSEVLTRAGEHGPWVVVSAGVGGIYSRIFSARHGNEVRGILLIDALHEDLLYRVGSPGRGFLLWGRGIISPLGLDRLTGALFRGRTREDRVYGRSAQQGDKFIKAKLQENLVANSLSKNEVVTSRAIQSKNTPLVVVSSGVEVRRDSQWERKQRDLTHLTRNLVAWDVVDKSPHEVWSTLEGREILEKRLKKLCRA